MFLSKISWIKKPTMHIYYYFISCNKSYWIDFDKLSEIQMNICIMLKSSVIKIFYQNIDKINKSSVSNASEHNDKVKISSFI